MSKKEYIERDKIISLIEKRQEKWMKCCDEQNPFGMLALAGRINELEYLKLVVECGEEDNA